MKALLVDYDGTLAAVDEKEFAKTYFQYLRNFVEQNFSVTISMKEILECVEHITLFADGRTNNYERFLSCFKSRYDVFLDWKTVFDRFYGSEAFDRLKELIRPNTSLISYLKACRSGGKKVVLATNPVFPKKAIVKRMNWIGLSESDFDLVTHMENSHFCKPDPRYFLQICSIIGVEPADCVMIGNDDLFDKACEKVSIKFVPVGEFHLGGDWDGSNAAE